MDAPDFEAAAAFIAANARVLDRRRFQRMFGDGPARPVRDAVAACRNEDGGFGHALEPDCRAPGGQPPTVELALRVMHEADAWDEALVLGACDWLAAVAPAEGGAAFVEAGPEALDGWPHAPWWVPQEGHPASLLTTGMISGTLHGKRPMPGTVPPAPCGPPVPFPGAAGGHQRGDSGFRGGSGQPCDHSKIR